MTTTAANLEAALRYAARGWKVFPIAAGQKVPKAGTHGHQDATTDPDTIRGWFAGKPHLNIGMATGQASGVWVLDVDAKTGGAETLIDWAQAGLELPETMLQKTGGGGRQYFFANPAGLVVRCNAGIIGQGIDLRGDGGYVVLPPSKRTGGGAYAWLVERDPVDAPAWLIEKIATGSTAASAGDPLELSTESVVVTTLVDHPGAGEGTRRAEACRLVGCELARGTSPERIVADAIAWSKRCRPPMSLEEIGTVLESLLRKEDAKPGDTAVAADDDYIEAVVRLPEATIPEAGWRPFPVEALPACLAEWITELARRSSTDPATIAVPILPAMAAAIGNSRSIRLNDEWTEPSVLWSVVVADSGMKKSVGHEKAVQFAEAIDKLLEEENKRDRERFDRETMIHEALVAQWKQLVRSKEGTSEPPPVAPAPAIQRTLTIDNTTPEAVAKILHDNPRGVLLQKDELSAWLSGFDRYSGGGGAVSSEAAQWLSMHNAKPLKVDRRSAERLRVDRAAVSICGCITPQIMTKAVGTEHLHSGMLQRFLLAAPPKRLMLWQDAGVPAGLKEPVRRMFESLFELPVSPDGPRPVALSAAAVPVWVKFYNDLARRRHEASGPVASMLAKSEAAAARIALVVHQGRLVSGEQIGWNEIDADSMRRGIAIALWFADEWQRIHGSTTGAVVDEAGEQLLQIVRESGGAVADRVVRNRRKRFRDSVERGRTVGRLIAAGRLETFTTEPNERGGPPALWLRIPDTTAMSMSTTLEKTVIHEVVDMDIGEDSGTLLSPDSWGMSTTPEKSVSHEVVDMDIGEVPEKREEADVPLPAAPVRIRRVF